MNLFRCFSTYLFTKMPEKSKQNRIKSSRFFKNKILNIATQSVIIVLITFCVLELTIRLFVPSRYWSFVDPYQLWQHDSVLGWLLRPSLDIGYDVKGNTFRLQTNQDSILGKNTKRVKSPGDFRIMFFGDSTVFGSGVPTEYSVPSQTESILRNYGLSVEVINAGIEGYSTDQALLRIRQMTPLYKPDLIFYGACINDLGGNEKNSAHGLSKPRFVLKDESLKIIPPMMNTSMPTLHRGIRKWLNQLASFGLFKPYLSMLSNSFGDWEEKNLLGLEFRFYYQPKFVKKVNWKLMLAMISEMKNRALKEGAGFAFYSHPELAEVWNPYIDRIIARRSLNPSRYNRYAIQNRLEKIAQDASVDYVPVIEHFLKHQNKGPFHIIPRDPHSNKIGSQLTAEVLSEYIKKSYSHIISKTSKK